MGSLTTTVHCRDQISLKNQIVEELLAPMP